MKETKTKMSLKTLEVTIHLQEQMTQKFKTELERMLNPTIDNHCKPQATTPPKLDQPP